MSGQRMLQRPLLGGPFGEGRFALATLPTISHGLHAVRFMVIEPRKGTVLAIADDKVQVLAAARRLLIRLPAADAANDAQWEQVTLWPEMPVERPPKVRRVSRRRREVFARSQGLCHYCHVALTLDGRWHVEHMMPRALGGNDEASNLVAACVPCNLAKSDCTALEFVAGSTRSGE